MLLRLILITSLVAQLVLSYRCCGVAIVRLDVVHPQCDSACVAIGSCAMSKAEPESGCCASNAGSCCGEQTATESRCCDDDSGVAPCGGDPTDCAPPLDAKKTGPEIDIVKLPVVLAYLLPPPAPVVLPAAITREVPAPVPWTSHQDRQARLSVWLN